MQKMMHVQYAQNGRLSHAGKGKSVCNKGSSVLAYETDWCVNLASFPGSISAVCTVFDADR